MMLGPYLNKSVEGKYFGAKSQPFLGASDSNKSVLTKGSTKVLAKLLKGSFTKNLMLRFMYYAFREFLLHAGLQNNGRKE